MISIATMQALENLYDQSREASEAFSSEVKRHATMHALDPQALARFVRARVADKVDKLDAERETWTQLSLLHEPGGLGDQIRKGEVEIKMVGAGAA